MSGHRELRWHGVAGLVILSPITVGLVAGGTGAFLNAVDTGTPWWGLFLAGALLFGAALFGVFAFTYVLIGTIKDFRSSE